MVIAQLQVGEPAVGTATASGCSSRLEAGSRSLQNVGWSMSVVEVFEAGNGFS